MGSITCAPPAAKPTSTVSRRSSTIWWGRADRARPVSAHTCPQPGANLALALDVHTNQLLEGIDRFLLLMKDQYQGTGSRTPIPMARLVAPVFAGNPSVTFVGVTNERGDVVESLHEFSPTNVADRDFFSGTSVAKPRDC